VDRRAKQHSKGIRVGFSFGTIPVFVKPDNAFFIIDENLFCPIATGRYAAKIVEMCWQKV
jgi:hypothetical protein